MCFDVADLSMSHTVALYCDKDEYYSIHFQGEVKVVDFETPPNVLHGHVSVYTSID